MRYCRSVVERGATGLCCAGGPSRRRWQAAAFLGRHGIETRFMEADLGRAETVEAVIAAADRQFASVDMLVNAAGLTDRGTTAFCGKCAHALFLMQHAIRLMRRDATVRS